LFGGGKRTVNLEPPFIAQPADGGIRRSVGISETAIGLRRIDQNDKVLQIDGESCPWRITELTESDVE
jgi:hypothetical protein